MTERRSSPAPLALALVVLTAGCLGAPFGNERREWSLTAAGHDEQRNGSYVFDGEVRLGGHYGDVVVEGVRVRFLDDQNRTVETVHVGELDVSRPLVNVTATTDRRPRYVLVEVERVLVDGEPRSGTSNVAGLRRVRGGDYLSYVGYDPNPTDPTTEA